MMRSLSSILVLLRGAWPFAGVTSSRRLSILALTSSSAGWFRQDADKELACAVDAIYV